MLIPETYIRKSMIRKDKQGIPYVKNRSGSGVVLPSRILIRQKNLTVSSRMCSIKTNIAISLF